MIVGCLIRNYKIYENIVFVPLSKQHGSNFSALVGENGVGKSSVLESLDTFFNSREWNINSNGKKDDAFVAPLFLIRKTDFKSKLDDSFLEFISNYFWSISESSNSNIAASPGLKEFVRFRDDLKSTHDQDQYYLFLLGVGYPSVWPFFATFNFDLRDTLEILGYEPKLLEKFAEDVWGRYAFVYIPVEASVNEVLRLESYELQELMSKDVVEVIDNILNRPFKVKREELGRENGPTEVNTTILKIVNENLQDFVGSVNDSIQKLDSTYSFTYEKNTKKSLTSADIRERIIAEYLSIRPLRKGGKPIQKLSSGEQRIALMDVAYSLLAGNGGNQRNVILAIDEPESSLHMSHCYKHFMRICELAEKFGHQVIVTSHWYGFIPVVKHGYLVYISNDQYLTFHLSSLRSHSSELGSLPDDIALKSIFDLVSSVIGLMRSEACDWVVCEGPDDQVYIDYFLSKVKQNFITLPMGGIGNVIKLYNYLYTPLNERAEAKAVAGKVLCIVDTDAQPIYPIEHRTLRGNLLSALRVQLEPDGSTKFLELNPNSIRYPTSLEDLLDAETFFEALKSVVSAYGPQDLIDLMPKLSLKPDSVLSGFSNNLSSLEGIDLPSHRQIECLKAFANQHHIKYKISEKYVAIHELSGKPSPDWVNEIVKRLACASG